MPRKNSFGAAAKRPSLSDGRFERQPLDEVQAEGEAGGETPVLKVPLVHVQLLKMRPSGFRLAPV